MVQNRCLGNHVFKKRNGTNIQITNQVILQVNWSQV